MIVKDVWLMHSNGALLQTVTHKYENEIHLFTGFLSAFNSIVKEMHGALSNLVISDVKFSFAARRDLIYILLTTPDVPSTYTDYVANFVANRYDQIAGNREFVGDIMLYNDFDDVALQALRDSGILFLNESLKMFDMARDVRGVCLVDIKENKPLILKIRKDIDEDVLQILANALAQLSPSHLIIAKKMSYYIVSGTNEWGIVIVMDTVERETLEVRVNSLRSYMPGIGVASIGEVSFLAERHT